MMTPEQARRNKEILDTYITPELEWNAEKSEINLGYCVKCNERKATKRSLCHNCYQQLLRDEQNGIGHDRVDNYPTQEYRKNMIQYMDWALEYNYELLTERARLQGYQLIVERTSTFGAPKPGS